MQVCSQEHTPYISPDTPSLMRVKRVSILSQSNIINLDKLISLKINLLCSPNYLKRKKYRPNENKFNKIIELKNIYSQPQKLACHLQ